VSFVINPYVFPTFWEPTQPATPVTLTGFRATTSDGTPITVTWGDGTTQVLTSNVAVNKTFNASSSGIDTDSQATMTAINCGTSSTKLGGVIDILDYQKLQDFRCNNNDITAISGYVGNSNLRVLQFFGNKVTGSIPSLTTNTLLQRLFCSSNQLTGSIPSLSANTQLVELRCGANQLTGSIPDLTNNTQLQVFYCQRNQLTGFAGGSVSNTLGDFQAENNQLTSTAVNAILAAFVAANRTSGPRILYLHGTGNAAPTGQGLTDKSTLLTRGWDVRTN
jgi:hypothetical protein